MRGGRCAALLSCAVVALLALQGKTFFLQKWLPISRPSPSFQYEATETTKPRQPAKSFAMILDGRAAAASAGKASSLKSAPILISLLNDDQMRMLGEIADKSVVKHVQELSETTSRAIEAALRGSPLAVESWQTADDMLHAVERYVTPGVAAAEQILQRLGLSQAQSEGATVALALMGTYAFLTAIAGHIQVDDAEIPTVYDLEKLHAYYKQRPLLVTRRFTEVVGSLASFGVSLLADVLQGRWDANMALRARQLRDLTSTNGPAFIKIGQGASIRPDILPQVYIDELAKLQDKVPPFSSRQARAIVERELKSKLEDVFADVSVFDAPIAAASLGQVYRAKLKNTGEEVAVKVQRPGVLATVTLDLYVMRIILKLLQRFEAIADGAKSIMGLIDSWAVRFLDELNYLQEAANAARFSQNFKKNTALGDAVIVPKVLKHMTTRVVLVTEWVDGVKMSSLDATTADGRARLATLQATLLNAYLTQLLEHGYLHADPHPGNFLLTPDGRVCIMDFGLMTEVTEDQRYALLQYVSHLIAKDYDATLQDLVTLQFVPEEVASDPQKVRLVVPLLAHILEQLSEGGGAHTITIESVGEEVEVLARNFPIQIPPYFGLIIRAFGVLEGLGLVLDPGYSIVKECFPYLARRLLTEDTPKTRKMLKTFLYGRNGDFLQVDRVDEIIEGYITFTSLAAEASGKGGGAGAANAKGDADFDPLSNPVAVDALKLLFNKEGTFLQDLVVEEMARMADAFGREFNLEAVRFFRRLGDGIAAPLPPIQLLRPASEAAIIPMLLPLQAPYLMLDRVVGGIESALELSPEDKQSLSALRRLLQILGHAVTRKDAPHNPLTALKPDGSRAAGPLMLLAQESDSELPALLLSGIYALSNPFTLVEAASKMAPALPLIAPGVPALGDKFIRRLAGRTLHRVAEALVFDSAEFKAALLPAVVGDVAEA